MRHPGGATWVLLATVACGGREGRQPLGPSAATPHPPAIAGLQTYLAGSTSSYVDFFVTDLDGDPVSWTSAVTTAPGCRCTAGRLRLAYLDQQLVPGGAEPAGTVASGTRIRLFYSPGSGSDAGSNNVLVSIDARDPSGGTARAVIEVPNW